MSSAFLCAAGLTDDGTLKTLLLDEPVLHLNVLGAVSDSEDNLVRTYLSPAHKRAAVLVRRVLASRFSLPITWYCAGYFQQTSIQLPLLILLRSLDILLSRGTS